MAEAFRPPTLSELHQGSETTRDLDPETLASTELSYVYREPGRRGLLTLFHTRLENLIVFRQSRFQPFINLDEIHLQGMEAEWQQTLGQGWIIMTNLSYTDTRDQRSGRRVAGSAKWLANATLEGPLIDRLRLGLRWHYVGKRARWQQDERQDFDVYHTLDLTLSWREVRAQKLVVRAEVNNLFDADVRVLAAVDTYPEDLPQPGRTWWAQVSYDLE